MRWAAFLRGINVGGNKAVKMADLRAAFEAMGFVDVRTVQASGNVVFSTPDAPGPGELRARIEAGLAEGLSSRTGVALRRAADLAALVAADPFVAVAVTPATRLYVTFLSRPAPDETDLGDERVRLVRITAGEVLTAIELVPGWGTPELMRLLESGLGKDVTTRSWNTVVKVAEATYR